MSSFAASIRQPRRRPIVGCRATGIAALTAIVALLAGPASAAPGAGPSPEARAEYDRIMQEGVRSNGLGHFRLAENAFRSAFDVCERLNGRARQACGDPLLRLALEVSNQRRFTEAELIFRRASRLIPARGEPLAYARYLSYRALHFANRRKYKTAFDLIIDANKRRKELLKTNLRAARAADARAQGRLRAAMTDLAHGLYVQAGVSFELGRIKEARITAHLARRLITRVSSAPDWWVGFVDDLLARIDRRMGNHAEAERRLRLAMKTKQLALGNSRPVALSRLALGSVYISGRRTGDALRTMRPALAIIRDELDRAPGITIDQAMPFLTAAHREARHNRQRRAAIYAEMFGASQLVQNSGFARTVSMMAARFASRDPDVAELVRRVQTATRQRDRLRLDLGRAAISLDGDPDFRRIAVLRAAYARAAREASELERDLIEKFPEYAGFAIGLPVPARELQNVLRRSEALVRFVIGRERGYAFVHRAGNLHVEELKITRKQVDEAVRRLRKPFESAGSRIDAFDVAASHKLYARLFGPIAAHLKGVRHLVSVSSGSLLSLPLGLLATKKPRQRIVDYRKVAWLAHRYSVSYLPSVRVFVALRSAERSATATLPFIGFGAPSLRGRPGGTGMASLARHCQVGQPVPPRLVRGLLALPETAGELRQVAKALKAGPGSIHIGDAASEGRLRRLNLHRYRVVYFATHGLLPGELRCQSEPALVLTPPRRAARSKASDGLLNASEIAGLRLEADLVVLSACNTGGAGGRLGGDALSGLTQAFFQAGARSLIVSHWQVDSKATARLMTRLFRGIRSGAGANYSEALRRARLKLIARKATAHPYFWAAFTFVGADISAVTTASLPPR